MSETSETLAFFAQLTREQLVLRAAPQLRSIEALARHIIVVRAA